MKKVIFGTALASMALLSACSSDNELANVGTTANNAIGFHVVGNKAETRATPITSSNLTTTDFKVYAFTKDGKAFMGENDTELAQNGINIKYKDGKWDYAKESDLRYWPNTSLDFYAVNPGTFEEGSYSEGMEFNYLWQITPSSQKIYYSATDEYGHTSAYEKSKNFDVMYGIAKDQTYTAENGGKVTFQFKHILSQVVFKAKTALASMEVNIKEIKIHNFRLGGYFTLPTTSEANGSWELQDPTNLESKWGTFTVVKDKNIDVTSAGANISVDAPMLFVPQKLEAWKTSSTTVKPKADADTSGEAYLEITCKIKQAGVYVFGSDSEYKTLYVPFGTTWEIGKCHIYTLIFGGGYDKDGHTILKPINFEANITDWVDADSNINM